MATKINGIEQVCVDEVGEIPHSAYNYQRLVGLACDVRLAKSGLPVGQRYKTQQYRNYRIGRGPKRNAH